MAKEQTGIKYTGPLLSWGGQKEEMLNVGPLEAWEAPKVGDPLLIFVSINK